MRNGLSGAIGAVAAWARGAAVTSARERLFWGHSPKKSSNNDGFFSQLFSTNSVSTAFCTNSRSLLLIDIRSNAWYSAFADEVDPILATLRVCHGLQEIQVGAVDN